MAIRDPIEGRPVLIVIDIQGGVPTDDSPAALFFMPGHQEAMDRAPAFLEAARRNDGPAVFFQEAQRRDLDAHQHDDSCRVVVAGSSIEPHAAALNAMEDLQTGARRSGAEVIAAFDTRASTAAHA